MSSIQKSLSVEMNTETQASLNSLFMGIKSILNAVKKQNPQYRDAVAEITALCDMSLQKQSFAQLSFKLKDLSVDIDQHFEQHRDEIQKHFQGLVRSLIQKNSSSYTPTQQRLIADIARLSEDKRSNVSEIAILISELSEDMATSMSAYRKESFGDKKIKNTEYAEGIDTVMAADVATAGKRISRDLQNLARQIKAAGSSDPEVAKILNEIEDANKGSVKFFESLDLLSRVTWLLYRLNDKSVHKEKEYLVNLSSQLNEISKSCVKSLALSSSLEEDINGFDNDFMSEINKIANSSQSAKSLQELKISLAQHVDRMQEKLSKHMLTQAVRLKEQRQNIERQQDTISSLETKIDSLQSELHDVSVESGIDQLTRLPNRKSYNQLITNKYKEFIANNESVSMMLIDIDFFKKINDTYGHDYGDAVLKEFSKILSYVVGKVDGLFAARFGGEEFILIGYGMDKRKFIQVGRKIREIISGKRFKAGNEVISVTVSIGVAFFNNRTDTVESVFRAADKALYSAKDGGRNQLWISNKSVLVKQEEKEI